jgi:hypothetical protein
VCPLKTKQLGGGGLSSSLSTLVNMNSTYPSSGHGAHDWFTDENNASGFDTSVTSYAVCGSAKGLTTVAGALTTAAPGVQTQGRAVCPGAEMPVGGGVLADTADTHVNINSSYPIGSTWYVYVNNGSAVPKTFTTYAICAGS